MMPPIMLAVAGEVAAGTFGGVAALLLVGGGIMLRAQRERNRFHLAKAALEKGMSLPSAVGLPGWIASLRQAVVILAVGLGLAAAGGLARGVAKGVPMPADADVPVPPDPRAAVLFSPTPPRPSLALERWHLAQDEEAVGLAAVGSGGVLVLLGVVRVVFAVVERRYEPAAAPAATRDPVI